MPDTNHIAIQEQHRNQSIKLTYYVIALCVAAIAFSVSQTMTSALSSPMILLGLAVICWGVSIFMGFVFLRSSLLVLGLNNDAINVEKGHLVMTEKFKLVSKVESEALMKKGMNMIIPENAHDGLMLRAIEESNKSGDFSHCQRILFYVGMVSFIGWRVWEMTSITS